MVLAYFWPGISLINMKFNRWKNFEKENNKKRMHVGNDFPFIFFYRSKRDSISALQLIHMKCVYI